MKHLVSENPDLYLYEDCETAHLHTNLNPLAQSYQHPAELCGNRLLLAESTESTHKERQRRVSD